MNSLRRTLILGLGNDLLRDDAVGLRIVQEIERSGDLPTHVTALASTEMGLSLLDLMAGFDRVVIVDSVQTRHGSAGQIHCFSERDIHALPLGAPHFLGIAEVLALGRALGMKVAEDVTVVAIEVEDPYTVGTELSPQVAALLPSFVQKVKNLAFRDLPGG